MLKTSDRRDQADGYEKAVIDYTEAIVLQPNDAQSYLVRSWALDKLGLPEKAALDRATAEELDPTIKRASRNVPVGN